MQCRVLSAVKGFVTLQQFDEEDDKIQLRRGALSDDPSNRWSSVYIPHIPGLIDETTISMLDPQKIADRSSEKKKDDRRQCKLCTSMCSACYCVCWYVDIVYAVQIQRRPGLAALGAMYICVRL